MKKSILSVFALIVVLCLAGTLSAQKSALPSMVVPDGLGYNIHFTDAKPGEMEMLAGSGATIIRMDFHWGGTEREKGRYDFSAYERLTDTLEKHKIRPLYILDYSNRHYDDGLSPHSEEGRTAFADWAVAAALHFKGRGILWEMYNEPNIHFWKPEPNAEKYILLALEVGRALRQACPDEQYIGPATASGPTGTIDYPFLEKCFKAGLLEYWDAVSVHPYRQNDPETVIEEYAKLRYLIDKYAPKDKKIPILSAEWGYSSVWHNFDDQRQGKYLPRQWMINLACDVPVSIWYDWHDDGQDPKEPEHHFGTVNHEHRKDQTPVYEPKPSYIAAKTFNETFRGYWLNKRLWTGNDDEFVFLFSIDRNAPRSTNRQQVKLAAWTTSKEPKTITIPTLPGKFSVVSYLGEKRDDLATTENALTLTVSDGPVYLTPEGNEEFWTEIASWASAPLAVCGPVQSPLSIPMRLQGPDSRLLMEFRSLIWHKPRETGSMERTFSDVPFAQQFAVSVVDHVRFGTPIPVGKELLLVIDNPNGASFKGEFVMLNNSGLSFYRRPNGNKRTAIPFELSPHEKETIVRIPLSAAPEKEYGFATQLVLPFPPSLRDVGREKAVYPWLLDRRMFIVDDFSKHDTAKLNATWFLHTDGDKNVGSEQKMEIDGGRAKITYRFDEGWKFLRFFPRSDEMRKIEGKPKAMALLLDGEGIGGYVNLRFADSKGQTFQVSGGPVREKKTYYFEFPLDGTKASHWGGPNDGTVHYPIRFDSVIIDGTRKACGPLSVSISSPVLIYE